jgi:hypothetical protein
VSWEEFGRDPERERPDAGRVGQLIAAAPRDLAWCVEEIERLRLVADAQREALAAVVGDDAGPVYLATVVYRCLTCGQSCQRNLVRGEGLPAEVGFRSAHRRCGQVDSEGS